MSDIVFVEGKITIESGNHTFKNCIFYASKELKELAHVKYNSDLIITENDKFEPYTVLCASEGIVFYGLESISILRAPSSVINIFKNEIEYLKRLEKIPIDPELIEVLNRQIYIGVVGSMELFLCDFFMSMVLGYKKFYKRFLEKNSVIINLHEAANNPINIIEKVVDVILNMNYHRIKDIEKIYNKTIGVSFENKENLTSLIKTRHKLVHRNGLNRDVVEYIKITPEMIENLILEVEYLVNSILAKRKFEIEEWNPLDN